MIGCRRYIDARINDLISYLQHQHDQDAESVRATKADLTSRLEGMNEFRAALAQQASIFVPRTEVEQTTRRIVERLDSLAGEHTRFVGRAEHDALADRISSIDVRLTRDEGTDSGAVQRTANLRQTIIVSVSILAVVMTGLIALLDHFVR